VYNTEIMCVGYVFKKFSNINHSLLVTREVKNNNPDSVLGSTNHETRDLC